MKKLIILEGHYPSKEPSQQEQDLFKFLTVVRKDLEENLNEEVVLLSEEPNFTTVSSKKRKIANIAKESEVALIYVHVAKTKNDSLAFSFNSKKNSSFLTSIYDKARTYYGDKVEIKSVSLNSDDLKTTVFKNTVLTLENPVVIVDISYSLLKEEKRFSNLLFSVLNKKA